MSEPVEGERASATDDYDIGVVHALRFESVGEFGMKPVSVCGASGVLMSNDVRLIKCQECLRLLIDESGFLDDQAT